MDTVATWLERYQQARQLRQQIRDCVKEVDDAETSDSTIKLFNQWVELIASMNTPELGEQAAAVHNELKQLVHFNKEINQLAVEIRGGLANRLVRQKKADHSVGAYQEISRRR